MKKNNYKIEVYTIDSDDGLQYYAHYPAVKGISGGGDTPGEAIEVLEEQLEEHLSFLAEYGFLVPDSDVVEEEYKGKIALRISPKLHKFVAEEARIQNISTNTFIGNVLSEQKGKRSALMGLDQFEKKLDDLISSSQSNVEIISHLCSTVNNVFKSNYGISRYVNPRNNTFVNKIIESAWQ